MALFRPNPEMLNCSFDALDYRAYPVEIKENVPHRSETRMI